MLAFLLLEDDEENEGDQIERQYWVQPCLAKKREQFGAFHKIFQEIRNDPKRCREYIRMNNNQFLYLVGLMSPDLQKQDTKMRDCITDFFSPLLNSQYKHSFLCSKFDSFFQNSIVT